MLKPLSASPTKAEEIAHYEAWIAQLPPGSYLAAMFGKTAGRVATEIRNDFAIGPVADVEEARRVAREEADLAKREKAEVEAQLRDLTAKRDALTREIATAKRDAGRMADALRVLAS